MKALTIKQPWAWSVIYAKRKKKNIENRTWNTSFRGTFAVHAGKALVRDAEFPKGSSRPGDDELEFGAIIGVVDLIEVVDSHDSPWFEGPYGFVLKNPRTLTSPIPIKGALNFWNIPPAVAKKIHAQLGDDWEEGSMGQAAVSPKNTEKNLVTRKAVSKSKSKKPPKKKQPRGRKKIHQYDDGALAEIHTWKNPKLGWFEQAMKVINWPLDKAGNAIFKTPGAGKAIQLSVQGITRLCNDVAQWSVRPESIYKEFRKCGHKKVRKNSDILDLDLEEVDKVVGWLDAKYKGIALVEGAGTGAIGLPGIAPDILALISINLRAIGEYASYYGFRVDSQEERLFAMNVLGLASSPSDGTKGVAMAQLVRIAQDVAKKRTWEQLEKHAYVKLIQQIAKALGIRLTKAKLAQAVPMGGAFVGAGFNAYFTAKVCDAAYYLYRERFLAEKYGADVIEVTVEPAEDAGWGYSEENEDLPQ